MANAFHELCSRLSLLGMTDGPNERALDRALRGITLDAIGPDGRPLLAEMSWQGAVYAVAYLLKKGADVNRLGARHPRGPALAVAMASTCSPRRAKAEIVKLLLAAGADPNAKIVAAPGTDGTGAFRSGTVLDYALAQAAAEMRVGREYDADSQRHAKEMVQSFRETIPLVIAAGGTMSAASERNLKKLGPRPSSARSRPLDLKKARSLVRKGDRDSVADLCERHLATAAAVAHPQWSAIVKAVIDGGRTFREVANEVYGKEVSFIEDEGWLSQGWERYVLLDLVFELLAKEETLRHPEWAALLGYGLGQRRTFDATSHTRSALEELFSRPWVRKHPALRRLRSLEKKTR